ncbi:glycogen debranching protein GlgX [Pseudorhizobium flavum]|uniref:Glycogen operon protein n=1 Tax=Pseudorhizobium flavum TaxID=1335061 RepID=A0A7W9Z146_9HYPH|nr:glycogen debranching protein GlgX [Pseudorhizobium flavum]MBB6180746.1 glycogen operon protein [Pseudorhizobium flavum]CAD6615291.1 glycogen debranching enzyme GlgX [Pseudorhizobium flavum]
MKLGTTLAPHGAEFAVWSANAAKIELCIFNLEGTVETARHVMVRGAGDIHRVSVPDIGEGTRYGYRAHGTYDPDCGLWFDPSKLLLDPYATEIDRPFVYDRRLADFGTDIVHLMPKAILRRHDPVTPSKPLFRTGGLIYELAVRPFTILHPDVPEHQRGTVAALAHPAVLAHLKRIGVDAVELMPITAWIDERHLPPLGLTNGWGYNPVGFMVLDPRLCPGGVAELRDTVAALHEAGIGVILDLVFNHTGESDRAGPTLSLRGLDNLACFRHVEGHPDTLVNDTGTGNTVACDHPFVRGLILDSLRHFVLNAGIDGFRFDLAPILGRGPHGFSAESETLQAMISDPVLSDRILIAEPWDIGPGGYQLGNFPPPFLEWNDRARDDIRRFWRGDHWTLGELATRLTGSQDIFARHGHHRTRSVNFIAAHDGFTLMDMVSHEERHNHANGEENRDGHHDNFSWNSGVEGATDDPQVIEARRRDVMALLATLFASRGAIMLAMGDEAGRSQGGNNNAYCQDNEMTWLDWAGMDEGLVEYTARLARWRKRLSVFSEYGFFVDAGDDIDWYGPSGKPVAQEDWQQPEAAQLAVTLKTLDRQTDLVTRIAVVFNRAHREQLFTLPSRWVALDKGEEWAGMSPPRSVTFLVEDPQAGHASPVQAR